jgi:hypothetical protein
LPKIQSLAIIMAGSCQPAKRCSVGPESAHGFRQWGNKAT